jgi:lipopolysaccharide export system permease protein
MRILSRYVLAEFLSFLGYALLAFAAVFILVDLVDNMDRFLDSRVGIWIIALNYLFYLPYILTLVLPMAMLLATMFSLGRLVGDNEITAMKASGISLYRILLPLYGFALFMGLVAMIFAEVAVPRANLQRQEIKEYIDARRSGYTNASYSMSLFNSRERDRDDVFLASGDGRILFARYYHARTKAVEKVCILAPVVQQNGGVFRVERIASRIDADSMVYRNGGWELYNVVERRFTLDGETQTRHPTLSGSFINLKPSDFAHIDIKPESMNFFQLRSYIAGIKEKGGDASDWLVDLYLKVSFPLVSFVIVFFGAPMVAGSVKRGKAASFGLALMISFVFYTFINAFQVLGRTGTINPLLAAWVSNALFFGVGVFMHARASM